MTVHTLRTRRLNFSLSRYVYQPSHNLSSVCVCVCVVQTVEVGRVLHRFTATDSDLGVNAALQYSLHQIQPNGDSEVNQNLSIFANLV